MLLRVLEDFVSNKLDVHNKEGTLAHSVIESLQRLKQVFNNGARKIAFYLKVPGWTLIGLTLGYEIYLKKLSTVPAWYCLISILIMILGNVALRYVTFTVKQIKLVTFVVALIELVILATFWKFINAVEINSMVTTMSVIVMLSAGILGNWVYPTSLSGVIFVLLLATGQINTIETFAEAILFVMVGTGMSIYLLSMEKYQGTIKELETTRIVYAPYRNMSLPDGIHYFGSWILTKQATYGEDPVGGDFVTKPIVNIDKRCFSITVCDLAGHGVNKSIAAAVVMATLEGAAETDALKTQELIHSVLKNMGEEVGGHAWALTLTFYDNGLIEYAGKLEYMIHLTKSGSPRKVHTNGAMLGPIESDFYVKENVMGMLQLEADEGIIVQTDGHVYGDDDDDQTMVTFTFRGERNSWKIK